LHSRAITNCVNACVALALKQFRPPRGQGAGLQPFSPVSPFPASYREGNVLYLEEDCDALTFVRAWEAEHGTILTHAIDHGDWSQIRNMARVQARTYEDEISF